MLSRLQNWDGRNRGKHARGAITAVTPSQTLTTPVLTWTSGTSTYDPVFNMTQLIAGDDVELQIDDNSDFGSLYDSDTTGPLSSGDATAGTISMPGISTLPTSGGTFYARARYTRGLLTSDWSATVSKTMLDTLAPTLSSPTGTQTGQTTATVGVTTNEANGTLYHFVSTSSTPPSAANLKTGTGAVVSGSQAVSSTGAKSASITGLTASTTYYTHWLHRDAAGNDSSIASGSGFTTASGSYTPQPVVFDGATRLARGTALTGAVSGKQGTASVWVKLTAGNGVAVAIFGRNSASGLTLERGSNGRFTLTGRDSTPTLNLLIRTTATTYGTASGWVHILSSWDLASGVAQLYVNGTNVIDASQTILNANIRYDNTDFGVGGYTASSFAYLTGEMMDLYINSVTSLDLSVQANREKFILAGAPVDLGSDGSLPTGAAPLVFQSGAVASWHTNKGSGGGLTLTGALTAGTYP